MNVLVTYASKHGATEEIARAVSVELETRGITVHVEDARTADPAPYDAVVVGSAVYAGRWRKEASSFLESNADELSNRPVWIFSSGPTGSEDPTVALDGWLYPNALESTMETIGPQEIVVFRGAIDPDTLNFFERFIVKQVKAPTGDFREWDAIEAWAGSIANDLLQI